MPYSYELDEEDEKKTAKAFGKEINMSPKKANETCYAIKGMTLEKALVYLEKVLKKQDFVPYRRYNKKVAHRTGGTPGGYPIKVVKHIIILLKNAKANAVQKGLKEDRLKIEHATAYKSQTFERRQSRGGGGFPGYSNIELTNVEIILREY